MRRFAREFSGHAWTGRQALGCAVADAALPYPAAKTGVVDGAALRVVSTAGADPEVLLLIEARGAGGGAMGVRLRAFSDWGFAFNAKTRRSSRPSGETNPFARPLHLYRIYPEAREPGRQTDRRIDRLRRGGSHPADEVTSR
jgi:hypothetical protein